MDDEALYDGKELATCSRSEQLKTFKLQVVKTLIECAMEQYDDVIGNRFQAILDSQEEKASVELHTNCYCSFTSKDHVNKLVTQKRKFGIIDNESEDHK